MSDHNGTTPKPNPNDSSIFPISDFPDIREASIHDSTRCKRSVENGDEPAEAPDADAPTPDALEADFGFRRSTVDEAREFLRQSRRGQAEKDELTEFLE